MTKIQTVRVPLLERVVLEELAMRWEVTANEAVARLIRQAARREVVDEPALPTDQPEHRVQEQAGQEVNDG
jgi:hypothetical protein